MKALIIILALVGVSFLGLVVWGQTRSDQPKEACEKLPAFKSGEEPSEGDLKNWCPPGIARATKGLQARFAPDLDLKREASLSSSSMGQASFSIASSDEKVRMAHIALAQGNAAILSDGDDGKLCLCRPNVPMDDRLFQSQCPDRWKSEHLEGAKPGQQRKCKKGEDAGILPFGEDGGRIELMAQPQATVTIR
jgi:hypothetical protein